MVVSERFHNNRALFICRHYGIDAVAFNAQPVSLRGQAEVTPSITHPCLIILT